MMMMMMMMMIYIYIYILLITEHDGDVSPEKRAQGLFILRIIRNKQTQFVDKMQSF